MGIRQGKQPQFLLDNDSKLVGLFFGADYCAEHEWGIIKTLTDFGVTGDKPGVDCRKMNIVPTAYDIFNWHEAKKKVFISDKPELAAKGQAAQKPVKKFAAGFCYFGDNMYMSTPYNKLEDESDRGVWFYNNTLWTGWCDGGFAAYSVDKDEQDKLREVYEAIRRGDAAIWTGGSGAFKNAGLAIAIISRLPPNVIMEWEKFDKEQANKAVK